MRVARPESDGDAGQAQVGFPPTHPCAVSVPRGPGVSAAIRACMQDAPACELRSRRRGRRPYRSGCRDGGSVVPPRRLATSRNGSHRGLALGALCVALPVGVALGRGHTPERLRHRLELSMRRVQACVLERPDFHGHALIVSWLSFRPARDALGGVDAFRCPLARFRPERPLSGPDDGTRHCATSVRWSAALFRQRGQVHGGYFWLSSGTRAGCTVCFLRTQARAPVSRLRRYTASVIVTMSPRRCARGGTRPTIPARLHSRSTDWRCARTGCSRPRA